jgi:hypothetical protein
MKCTRAGSPPSRWYCTAIFIAASFASVPPLVKNTLDREPGVRSASWLAARIVGGAGNRCIV